MKNRLDFSRFVDWAFMAILSTLMSLAVNKISDLSTSVNELNTKMEVVITSNAVRDERLSKVEQKIEALEAKVWNRK